MKKCNRCKEEKPLDLFFKNPWSPDGIRSICKECVKKTVRKYMQNNREKYNAIHRRTRSRKKKYYQQYGRRSAALWRSRHPWYQSYSMARDRCTNKKRRVYKYYGAKGV